MADDFWAKTTRLMLASVKEVGAMPFILFEYYLTWQTAPDGIKPSLQRIADDLGMEKNAVCNLRSRLIKAGWIRYENDEVFITKSFTKNESRSQKMNKKAENHSQIVNDDSQKMNESFTKNESHIRNSKNIQKEQEKEEINTLSETDVLPEKKSSPKKVPKPKTEDAPELVKFRKTLAAFQKNYAEPTTQGAIIGNATAVKKLFSLARGDTAICVEAHLFQQAEEWRKKRVDWITVHKDFNFFLENRKNGATNAITKQTNFQTTADRRDERAIAEFQLTESIRARLNSGGNV